MRVETEEFNNNEVLRRRNIKRFLIIGITILFFLLLSWIFYKGANVLIIAGEVGVYDNFKIEKESNRLDVLILGIRGVSDKNGGLLADTMILVSFDKEKEKIAIVSLPRDLFVEMPNYPNLEKINFAYALGEQRSWGGGGLALSKEVVKYVTGVYVDDAIVINFEGFKKLVDILGGVAIYREKEFVEGRQWQGEGIEGSPFWELVTALEEVVSENQEKIGDSQENDEVKTNEVPMLTETQVPTEGVNKYWVFKVPKGTSTLSGENVLYYVRSRFSSSDFDRIKRQHQVVSALKSKTLSLGVLGNPIKVFNILDTLGDNVRTDMGLGDVREYLSLVQKYDRIPIETTLLDTSEGGLLVAKNRDGRFILVPRAGDEDFSEIREFFINIFN